MRIQEEERRAISREIHDQLGQQVTAINLDLKLAKRDAVSLDRRGLRASVEARSVNNRHLKITVRASPLLAPHESAIEEMARGGSGAGR